MNSRQGGFSYLFMLFMVALGGIMMLASVQTAWMESRRDKEAELLHAGNEIKKAIDAYAKAFSRVPGASEQPAAVSVQQYPKQLEDLLEDRRFTPPLRHLRRIYIEPMSGSKEWGTVREGERIVGVFSTSLDKPLKTANFPSGSGDFAQATRYSDWKFVVADSGAAAKSGVSQGSPAMSDTGGAPAPGAVLTAVPAADLPSLNTPDDSQPSAEPPPSNSANALRCNLAYSKAVRGCGSGGNNAQCVAGAQAARQACMAG